MITRHEAAAVGALTTLVLLAFLTLGLFDSLLLPASPVHGEGRAMPGLADAEDFSPLDWLGLRLSSLRPAQPGRVAVGEGLDPVGAAGPAGVAVGPVTCEDWIGLLPGKGAPSSWTRSGKIEHITIHSAGYEGQADARRVAGYHVGVLGWEHAAYNLIILKSGVCQLVLPTGGVGGVPLGATVMPYGQLWRNPGDISLMLEGLVEFTPAQLRTLSQVVTVLAVLHEVPPEGIVGHRTWTQRDQARTSAGTLPKGVVPNDHVDPCASAAPCAFDTLWFGLRDAVREAQERAPAPSARYDPPPRAGTVWGKATWYGPGFEGNVTACGQVYRQSELTTAVYLTGPHQPAWPCGTRLRVSSGGRSVIVTVTDTGAFSPSTTGGTLDLSRGAFARLADPKVGVLPVRIEPLK